jgi:hypothetical protein
MDACYRPGVDIGGIEQCKEDSFGPAIGTLNNQPAFIAAGARPAANTGSPAATSAPKSKTCVLPVGKSTRLTPVLTLQFTLPAVSARCIAIRRG